MVKPESGDPGVQFSLRIASLSCAVTETVTKSKGGKVYSGRQLEGIQSIVARKAWGREDMMARLYLVNQEAKISNPNWKHPIIFNLVALSASWASCLDGSLFFQNGANSWEPSIQIHKPVRDISYLNNSLLLTVEPSLLLGLSVFIC